MPDSIKTQVEVTNNDDSKLAELGYKPELRRQYSPLALAGVAVVVCNSWGAVGGALITGKLPYSKQPDEIELKELPWYRSCQWRTADYHFRMAPGYHHGPVHSALFGRARQRVPYLSWRV